MDGVTRSCSELVADLADRVGGGVPTLVFLTVLAAILTALGWYFWPAWLPWRWHWRGWRRRERRTRDRRTRRWGWLRLGRLRWRLPRWRRRRRRTTIPAEPADLPADALPDVRAEVLAITADQLAAAGRFAEAVRERLRAIVRDLIERDVLPPSPGWTVTELARGAASAMPPLATPLDGAVVIFSEIWYGLRPATGDDDAAMRAHAATVAAVLTDSSKVAAVRHE
jgi:Domain of unknown function (DUF4129)